MCRGCLLNTGKPNQATIDSSTLRSRGTRSCSSSNEARITADSEPRSKANMDPTHTVQQNAALTLEEGLGKRET